MAEVSGMRKAGEEITKVHHKTLGVMDRFTILIVEMALTVFTYVKIYQIIYFKYVYFTTCQLYLNRAASKK